MLIILGLLNKFLITIFNKDGGSGVIIKSADFVEIFTFFNIIIQFLEEVNLTLIVNDARAVNMENDLIREFLINLETESVDKLFVNFIIAKA